MRALLLPLIAVPLAAQQVLEGPEPNQSIATSTPLPAGREASGQLSSAADVDWYAFTLAAAADVRLETAPGPGAEVGDTVLTLLDATGSPLRSDDDGVRSGFYSRLYANGLAAGSYHVAVERGANAAASGSYVLDLRTSPPVSLLAPPVVGEGVENNDPRSGGVATSINLPARCNGQITSVGPTGDWDFYRFALLENGFVQLRVSATARASADAGRRRPGALPVRHQHPARTAGGPFYASNFGVFDTAVDLRLPAGVYQAAIRGWTGSIAGRYYLDVHRSGAALASVFVGGCGGRALDVATTTIGPGSPLRLEAPVLGTTWALRGSNLGAGGFVFHAVGFQSQNLDLTTFGAPGCTLEVVFVDTPLQIAEASGASTFFLALPEQPSLLGAALESQLAVLDFSNPLGLTLSNRVRGVLGS